LPTATLQPAEQLLTVKKRGGAGSILEANLAPVD
jgi:hypothetical protein